MKSGQTYVVRVERRPPPAWLGADAQGLLAAAIPGGCLKGAAQTSGGNKGSHFSGRQGGNCFFIALPNSRFAHSRQAQTDPETLP